MTQLISGRLLLAALLAPACAVAGDARGSRPGRAAGAGHRFPRHGRHAVRLGAEHLVSHAQRRFPDRISGETECWSQKERFIKPDEMEEARRAFAHAREVYRQRLGQCVAD